MSKLLTKKFWQNFLQLRILGESFHMNEKLLWNMLKSNPYFGLKSPIRKIFIFKNKPFQRFLLGLCQKMFFQNMLKSGLKVLGSNCWDKTKENVFFRLLWNRKKLNTPYTSRIPYFIKKLITFCIMLLWFIGELFGIVKDNEVCDKGSC